MSIEVISDLAQVAAARDAYRRRTEHDLLESLKQRLGGLLRRRPRPAADAQPQSTNEFVA